MNNKQQNSLSDFFSRYKIWFKLLAGMHIFSIIFFTCMFLGVSIYLFVNNDSNWHPYKSYIEDGYSVGLIDGNKEYSGSSGRYSYSSDTPWHMYNNMMKKLEKDITKEKDEYLMQFPYEERVTKRAEMHKQGILLPKEKETPKRFKKPIDFYADYVAKRVRRDRYESEKEYKKALQDEAWNVGYNHGYVMGRYWGKGHAGEKL